MKKFLYCLFLIPNLSLHCQQLVKEKYDWGLERSFNLINCFESGANNLWIFGTINYGDHILGDNDPFNSLIMLNSDWEIQRRFDFAYKKNFISPYGELFYEDDNQHIKFISTVSALFDQTLYWQYFYQITSSDNDTAFSVFQDTNKIEPGVYGIRFAEIKHDKYLGLVDSRYLDKTTNSYDYVLEFDSTGKTNFKKYLPLNDTTILGTMDPVNTQDGNIAILSLKNEGESLDYLKRLVFLKYDLNYNELERKIFDTPDRISTATMIQNTNSDFVIGYNSYSPNMDSIFYKIIVLDNSGNLKLERNFVYDSALVIYSIVNTKDGGLLLSGYHSKIKKQQVDLSKSQFYVLKLDKNYNFEWDYSWGDLGYSNILKKAVEMTDGVILASGTRSINMYLAQIQPPGASVENTIFQQNVKVYPNPLTSSSALTLDVPEAGVYTISVTDMLGITRTLYENKYLESGENVLMDTQFATAPGAYFINIINAAGERVSKKVVVE